MRTLRTNRETTYEGWHGEVFSDHKTTKHETKQQVSALTPPPLPSGVTSQARFRWTDITARSAHWEQAFSTDGGQTWLDNWYMDATRRP